MHRKALERFDFDTVLCPFSFVLAQNEQYLKDFTGLAELCRSRNVAIQTIKSIVHRPWGDDAPNRATWYRPLEDQNDIDRAVTWVLGHEGLFLNSAGDIEVLPKVLDAANRFEAAPTDDEMKSIVDKLGMRSLFDE
jgi:hypothetical protein